jgi:hypothetical protein
MIVDKKKKKTGQPWPVPWANILSGPFSLLKVSGLYCCCWTE